jgi:ABC-2 type transport system ATP-binding protein
MTYFGEPRLAAGEARSCARAFLERVGLADKALAPAVPGGAQRGQLGVTVLNDPSPDLDEPTKALDPVNRELLLSSSWRKQRGTTIAHITHQMDEVERLPIA